MANWPVLRSYESDHLLRVAMPLGGIGTGTVSLGGRGDLRDWEVMNRPAKGFVPRVGRFGPLFAFWAGDGKSQRAAGILEGPIDETCYDGWEGSPVTNHGMPRFGACRFEAAYPLAQVYLSDDVWPVRARLEAFNPLVPGDADASGLPAAVLRYVVENTTDRELSISVCGMLPNFVGANAFRAAGSDAAGNKPTIKKRNRFFEDERVQGIAMDTTGLDASDPSWGSMALGVVPEGEVSYQLGWPANRQAWGGTMLEFWDQWQANGRFDEATAMKPEEVEDGSARPIGSVSCMQKVKAGESATFTFVIAWHFPNRQTWSPKEGAGDADNIGNYYCTRFADAAGAAKHVAGELEQYEKRTVDFVRAFCESDYPEPMKEAALFNLSTLRTQTCFRTRDGRFFAFEGCKDDKGYCEGSCTHVWNYEQVTAFLFGDLARGMREVEFSHATDEQGCMSFRVHLPLERAQEYGKCAADGQMGCLMKLYRDWQLSGDDDMLRTLWPMAKKVLAFCWIEHGWDADRDGVMEGCQHNTMDVEYHGPNPQMTGWYLGALKAMEAMAQYLGDDDMAKECARLFASGSTWMDEHLWNGQYYEQDIRPPADGKLIPTSMSHGKSSEQLERAEHQLGKGCLVDQLVGQYMAHICGLGYLHDERKVKTTLDSIVRLNRRRGFNHHFNPMRSYAMGDETALLMAAYPPDQRPAAPFPYFAEVMTGFEYTAAAGLIYEGEDEEGVKIIRDIRNRYDGRKRNPFCEAEAGWHYARAMASWASLLAWTGFRYSAVDRTLDLAPRAGRFFWSAGSAWGSYELKKDSKTWRLALHVNEGQIAIETARVAGEAIEHTLS